MLPKNIENFKRSFSRLPGVGLKTSERLAFYILAEPKEYAEHLAKAIIELKENSRICSQCGNISESDPCIICINPTRDKSLICVVETALDIYAIEATGSYKGLYFVLGGLISPLNGITPSDLNFSGLLRQIKTNDVIEVIVAMSATTEGDTTAMYIRSVIDEGFGDTIGTTKPKITSLARGIPMGTDLQYAGKISLSQAIKHRETLD